MSLKQISIAIVSFILIIGLMFGMAYYFSDIEKLKSISGSGVTLLVVLSLGYKSCQGLILRSSLHLFNIHTKFKEWMGLLFITLFGNFLIPMSGIGFRALYLKKKHNLPITQFISSVGIIYLIEMVCYALFGILGLLTLEAKQGIKNPILLTLFVCIVAALLVLPFIASWIAQTVRFLPEKLKSMLHGLSMMKTHKTITFQIAMLTVLQALFFNAIFWVCYREIKVTVPYIELFVVSSLADFAFFFRLLPAALGSYEGFIWFGNKALGLTQENAFLVIALTRTVIFLIVLVFAPIFSYWLIKKSPIESESV